MGLSSAHRLKNYQDYRTVYEQGIRRYSPHLTLVALHNGGNGKQVNSRSEITEQSQSTQAAEASSVDSLSVLAGERGGHAPMICPYIPQVPPITPTKVGISIGKKVSKKAVVRNRIKRQIRSAIASNLKMMAPGWKIVIVVRPEAIKCKYEHFLRELEELLKQAKIINGY